MLIFFASVYSDKTARHSDHKAAAGSDSNPAKF